MVSKLAQVRKFGLRELIESDKMRQATHKRQSPQVSGAQNQAELAILQHFVWDAKRNIKGDFPAMFDSLGVVFGDRDFPAKSRKIDLPVVSNIRIWIFTTSNGVVHQQMSPCTVGLFDLIGYESQAVGSRHFNGTKVGNAPSWMI